MSGRRLLVAALPVVALLVAALPVAAQPGADDWAAAAIASAADALDAGDHAAAAASAGRVARSTIPVPEADRAEAFRLLGLARFHLGERAAAEVAFLEHLRLRPESHLDPALVPPEAIVFFEDVRAQHAAELDALRPPPDTVPSPWLNLVPSGGQFQNGDRGKGWLVLGGTAALAAVNVSTFVVLQRWCDDTTSVCGDGGSRGDDARALRAVNLASGVALVGLYAYSVIDGWLGYRASRERAQERAFGLVPAPGGAALVVGGRF